MCGAHFFEIFWLFENYFPGVFGSLINLTFILPYGISWSHLIKIYQENVTFYSIFVNFAKIINIIVLTNFNNHLGTRPLIANARLWPLTPKTRKVIFRKSKNFEKICMHTTLIFSSFNEVDVLILNSKPNNGRHKISPFFLSMI